MTWGDGSSTAAGTGGGVQPLIPSAGISGEPYVWFSQPPVLLQGLHEIDRKAGASVVAPEAVTTRSTRDRYLLSSLMEEAITSSQMEGAATTRDVDGVDGGWWKDFGFQPWGQGFALLCVSYRRSDCTIRANAEGDLT